jgi:hypothetical protein
MIEFAANKDRFKLRRAIHVHSDLQTVKDSNTKKV